MSHIPVDLSNKELEILLQNDWKLSDKKDSIKKQYIFADFCAAFSFMTQIALKSEKLDHHPEWLNVYNKLEITWSTHDLAGLSQADLRMAQFCDDVYCKFK